MVSYLEQTLEQLKGLLLLIKIVKRFTTWHTIPIDAEQEQLQSADTEAVTDMVRSQLKLHHNHTGRESRAVTALMLLKSHLSSYQGHVQAALVLGEVDVTGLHLHTVQHVVGSTDTLPFSTMGSGSLAAMVVF